MILQELSTWPVEALLVLGIGIGCVIFTRPLVKAIFNEIDYLKKHK